MFRDSNTRTTIGGGLLAVAALAGAFAILAPASAQSAVKQLISLACADHQPCLSLTNKSTGNAIAGVAQNNAGIFGRININTNKDPNNINPANGGVLGVDASTNQTDSNVGVLGTSANGSGVAGITSFDSSVSGDGQAGVEGFDLNNKAGGLNVGVYGQSYNDAAVLGLALNDSGAGIDGEGSNSGTGVFGLSNDTASDENIGVAGEANYGIGVLALSHSTAFPSGPASLMAINDGDGDPIRALNADSNPNGTINVVMRLDHAGNMTLAGTLTQNGAPVSVSSTSSGAKVLTYSAQQSVRTVEDVGEAQLIHGQAAVSLERTFASAIDRGRSYLVFITPQGDNNGLYVAQKTASGFIVREHNGASNIAFDYRIVAQPYGSPAQRLPAYSTANMVPGAAERYMMKRVLSLKRIHRVRYQQR
jgi:hypothetical protein